MEIVGNIPVEEQEMTIRRDDWSVEVINRICTSIREWALENRKSIYILARVNGFVLYSSSTGTASRNNTIWAEKKARLAEQYGQSSLRVSARAEKDPRSLEEQGLNYHDYGISGGSFPILLSSGLCIGSITVSGMKGEEDHQLVVDSIRKDLEL